MNSPLLKKALPHLLAVLVFLVVAVVYCRPALEGKVVNQSDVQQWKAMAQQSFQYKEKYGHYPLWTESTFSGMPAYTIAISGSTMLNYAFTCLRMLKCYSSRSQSVYSSWPASASIS